MSRIYVASSWRNDIQPHVVAALRAAGHEVYDFKNPPKNAVFGWEEVAGPEGRKPTVEEFKAMLDHPRACQGYVSDLRAMEWADTCVMVLPCNRSAHTELGWFCGKGKRTIVLTRDHEEPELMYLLANHIVGSIDEAVRAAA